MKRLKKLISSFVITCSLLTVMPSRQADAGIIFIPIVIGIVFLVIGIENHDTLLIVLDADGSLPQDQLEQNLAKKYGFIDDRDVIHNLSTLIKDRALTAPLVNGKKLVSLTQSEVLTLLEPTGLAELEPTLVAEMVNDLK